MERRIPEDVRSYVTFFSAHQGRMPGVDTDSVGIRRAEAVSMLYAGRQYRPLWSDSGAWLPGADSLLALISRSAGEGLNPAAYHGPLLGKLFSDIRTDSSSRRDAVKWSVADILLTDAFMRLADNVHFGLLPPDSISLKDTSTFADSVLQTMLQSALARDGIARTIDSLSPSIPEYAALCRGLQRYRQAYMRRKWDTLPSASADTAGFDKLLAARLLAGGELDSAGLHSAAAVKKALMTFQRRHGLYPDGKAGKQTIAALNLPASYRIKQIEVNLERWRHMADSMPETYILVNIPSYTLTLWDHDSAAIVSRVIVGKPGHNTPLLNSHITNFQLYPYWRVPASIIGSEMLPAIRKDTGYLRKHNLQIVDRHDHIVDPSKLHWNRYTGRSFPYVMRQMTGLDNSLGIVKFNFRNKYSVYLHDTNLRNLFNLTGRDLSHGCVRVQQWEPLAMFLIRDDTLRHVPDSVDSWLNRQVQKTVALKRRVPIYIRYFTCTADSLGKLTFYPDIYGYDRRMMKRMFR
jgi:murein L,D-transpeptidase YcbB/YkuD